MKYLISKKQKNKILNVINESKKKDEVEYYKNDLDGICEYFIDLIKEKLNNQGKEKITKNESEKYLKFLKNDINSILESCDDMDEEDYFKLDDYSIECVEHFKNFLKSVSL